MPMKAPTVENGVICAYGELVEDIVATLAGPLYANSQVPGRFESRPGGAGPNVARAAARAGARARFVGHVGDDQRVPNLLEHLHDIKVDVVGLGTGRHASALALQMTSGETSLVFDAGERGSVKPADLDASVLDDAAIVHLASFNLYDEATRPAFERMIEIAHQRDVCVSIDVSVSNQLLDFGLNDYREFLAAAEPTMLFCNEQEADLLEIMRAYPKGVGSVICHRGPAPALVLEDDGAKIDSPVPVVSFDFESIGAGDAFAGGFLAAWQRGADVETALRQGHNSASQRL